MPPRNLHLADSNYAMGHADSAQQDALPQAGPMGPTRALKEEEIQYTFTGPGYFGIQTSGVYPDGKRVFWGNGLDRLVKLDYETHEIVAQKYFPGETRYTEEQSEASIASFEESNDGIFAIFELKLLALAPFGFSALVENNFDIHRISYWLAPHFADSNSVIA